MSNKGKQETFFVADSVTLHRILAHLRYGPGAGYKDRKVAKRRHPGEPVFKITVETPDDALPNEDIVMRTGLKAEG